MIGRYWLTIKGTIEGLAVYMNNRDLFLRKRNVSLRKVLLEALKYLFRYLEGRINLRITRKEIPREREIYEEPAQRLAGTYSASVRRKCDPV